MNEKPASPYNFTTLDSNLIRSTKRKEPTAPRKAGGEHITADVVIADEAHHYSPPAANQSTDPQPELHVTDDHATIPPRHHAPVQPPARESVVVEIHKAVKQVGRFEGTHRYTEEEKDGLDELIRAFKKKRIRTSENEIARIGINYLLEDYQRNGEQSVLAQVLTSLHH